MGRLEDLIKSAIAYELADTTDTSRRELWESIGEEYEMQGIPKEQIGERIRQAIEPALERALGHKVSIYTAHHHRIISAKGWLRLQGAGKGGKHTSEKNVGFISAISEVQDQVLFAKSAAKDLDMSSMSTENYDLLCREIRTHAAIMHDFADGKTKLPPNLHMLFRSIIATVSGMNAIARTFHSGQDGHAGQGQGRPGGLDHAQAGGQSTGLEGDRDAAAGPAQVTGYGDLHGLARPAVP